MRRSIPRSRHTLVLVIVATIVILLAGSPGRAIDENLTKGATNNHVFESGMWGENIDNLNGGLNLTIPLGPEYRVSSDVSYQLQVSYSSKIWQLIPASRNERSRSRLTGRGQAGLGFMLHLGRRYKHVSTPDCENYEDVFEDQTGAIHPFDGLVTTDGSYLRYVSAGGGQTAKILRPDGTRLILGQVVPDLLPQANWPTCEDTSKQPLVDIHTNDRRGEYVTRIEGRDRDGTGQAINFVNIEYEPAGSGMEQFIKTISDSTGRVIHFENTAQSGPARVTGVHLPAFGGATADYAFSYQVETLDDIFVASDPATPHGTEFSMWDPGNPSSEFPNAALLTSIAFPHGYSMSFEYDDPDWGNSRLGLLTARALPTGARVEYDYALYPFQHQACRLDSQAGACQISSIRMGGLTVGFTDCSSSVAIDYGQNCFDVLLPGTVAVKTKRVIPNPAEPNKNYTWSWERDSTIIHANQERLLPNPWKVTMHDPYGNDTVSYYSFAWPPPQPGTPSAFSNDPWWKNGLLSLVQHYRGSSADQFNMVRAQQNEWEDTTDSIGRHAGHFKRVKETQTFYADGGSQARTVSSDWDEYGHFRVLTEYGFDGQVYRVRRTGYNCDSISGSACAPRPAHTEPSNWVLNTWSFQETLDPNGQVLQRSEYQFDDHGYLKTQRDLLTPSATPWSLVAGNAVAASPGDIVTEYCYEGETNCGAPTGPRTGNLHYKGVRFGDTPAQNFDYREFYGYEGPYLETKQIDGMSWMSEDKDVDPQSGLTEVSRDPAGIQTTFDYDLLGRLTIVTPVSVNGVEQPVILSYPNLQTTELTQSATTGNFIFSRFQYDGLGRPVAIEKRQPNGQLVTQITKYDEAGRMTFQSEWVAGTNNNPTGTSYEYRDPMSGPNDPSDDPFGRVRRTQTADGAVTLTNYAGTSSTVIVEGIEGQCGGPIQSSTTYERDAFGRLIKVLSARGASASDCSTTIRRDGADAYYTYDRLDRLTRVMLEAEDDNIPISQFRYYTYDALGRRLTETNPENGMVTQRAFDVLGNVLEAEDAAGTVFLYAHDAASRLTSLARVVGTGGQLATMAYDQTGFGYSAGKLTSITTSDPNGSLVQEVRHYNGLNGRLSERKLKIRGWDPTKTFANQPLIVMNYSHDSLGLPSGLTYPEIPGSARQVANLNYYYSNGHLTSVGDASRGVMVEALQYNPAGGVEMIRTRGGVETLIVPDVRNRPASILVTGPPAPYCGDGSCNNSETCDGCPQDCGQCGDPGDPGSCQPGQICQLVWVLSAQRTIGQSPVSLYDSGPYEYDGAGNISRIGLDHFKYDTLNRLVQAAIVSPTGNVENDFWSYDDFGNMLSQHRVDAAPPNSWSINHDFTVDPIRNQLEQFSLAGSVSNVAYDENGNMISDGTNHYGYDARGRLIDVYESNQQVLGDLIALYSYDNDGYRLSKVDAATGTTTYFLRDLDGRVLSEFRRPYNAQSLPSWSKDYVYAAGRHVALVENEQPDSPGGIQVSTSNPTHPPSVTVTWEPVPDQDLLEYRLYRVNSSGTNQLLIQQNPTLRTYTDDDPNLVEGQTYTYRITAMDEAANESEPSEPVVATPGDTTPPPAPSLLLPTSGDQWVRLKWTKPSPADVWSYRAYRRVHSTGGIHPWLQLGTFRGREITDRTVVNGVSYDYHVTALDTSELESNPSNERLVTPVDIVPPTPPQGLFATAGATQVELSWQPSPSPDLPAPPVYYVYRSEEPIEPQDIYTAFRTTVTSTMLVDSAEPLHEYYYRVAVKDNDNNLSDLSSEIVVHTRDAAVAVPQFVDQKFDYCRRSSCCLPQNDDCDISPTLTIPRIAARENFLMTHATASTQQLKELHVYRRRFSSEPFELVGTLPKPGAPVEYPLVVDLQWQYEQFAFNAADACSEWQYRVSAVKESGAESALSTVRQMAPKLMIPENPSVPAEPLPKDPDGFTRTDLSALENPEQYGLTLHWTSLNQSCGSSFAGYHVYRSRRRAGFSEAPDYDAPPIRLTREPIGIPMFRVQYLSNVNDTPLPYPIFPGVPGRALGTIGYTYAVTAVDVSGNESESSSGVVAHTNSEDFTRPGNISSIDNHEVASGLSEQLSHLDGMQEPGSFSTSEISWEWHYGHQGNYVVGPAAGNWALMTWGEISQGYPNEIQISRQVGADPNYYIMGDLAPIPGDDLGVREFVWHIDPNLACQDAHYRVRGVDLMNPPGPWSDPPLTVPKHTLVPENPSILLSASAPRVTITWDELPSCAGRLLGYKVFRTDATMGCSAPMPQDFNFAILNTQTIPAGTELFSYSPSFASVNYWYRVKAIWSVDGGATTESAMSAGVCTSAEKGQAPPKVWAIAQGFLGFPNWDASTCNNNCMGVVWDPPSQPVGPILGYNIYRSAPVGQCNQTMPSTGYEKINEDLVPNTDTSWQYNDPPTGWYWFRVKAVYPGGESDLSSQGDCASRLVSQNTLPAESSPEVEWRQARLTPNPSDDFLAERNQNATISEEEVRPADDLVPSTYRVIGQAGSNPPIKMSFYHLDHLGTPRVITDVAGQVISTHKYLPFGEELNPPPSTNTHEFTGHERDAETGLDYMLARYYGSWLARLMSPDPVGGQLQSPQSWNLYAYVGNNPLGFSDPLGLYKVTGAGADEYNQQTADAIGMGIYADENGDMQRVEGPATIENQAAVNAFDGASNADFTINATYEGDFAVDNFGTTTGMPSVNPNAIGAAPAAPTAAAPEAVTRGELITHQLTEFTAGFNAGGFTSDNYPAAHAAGIEAQNAFRSARGQSPVQSSEEVLQARNLSQIQPFLGARNLAYIHIQGGHRSEILSWGSAMGGWLWKSGARASHK